MLKKIFKSFKIIFSKNIDASTPEGREQKRAKAIALTAITAAIEKIFATLIPLITVSVSRKYLGEEIYGLWMTVTSLFAVFQFADLGLGNGLQTNLSHAAGKDNNVEECRELISSTFTVLLSVSGGLIAVFLACYGFVDWASVVNAQSSNAVSLAGPAFLAVVIPNLINIPISLIQRTQLALQEGHNYHIWGIFGRILSLASVYLIAWLNLGPITLIACSTSITVVMSFINMIVYYGFKRKEYRPKFKYCKLSTVKLMFVTGVGFLLIAVLRTIGLSNLDNFIVANIDGLSTAGDYAICLKVSSILNIVVTMFGAPLWGVYGEAYARRELGYIKKNTYKMATMMLGLVGFATVVCMIVAKPVFYLWLGAEFEFNYFTLLGMLILQCLYAWASPFFMVLNGTGFIKKQIIAYAVFTVVSFPLKWILASQFGVHVMPWITGACYGLIMIPWTMKAASDVYNGKTKANVKSLKENVNS